MRLAEHPALAGVDAEALARVEQHGTRLELTPGEVVFRPGAPCRGLPLVLEGCVRVQMTACSGQEMVLYRIGDADVCTLSIGCLMGGAPYRAEAIVERTTRAVVLHKSLFDELVDRCGVFRRHVMNAYGERIERLMLRVEEAAFGRMDTRLAQWLNQCAGPATLAVTHQDIAVELGTAREVVSRLLKDFERRGWLRLRRGAVERLAPIPFDAPGGPRPPCGN